MSDPQRVVWLLKQAKACLAELNSGFQTPVPATRIDSLTLADYTRCATLDSKYINDPNAVPRLTILARFQ